MTTPDQSTTPSTKKGSLVSRIALVFVVIFAVLLGMVVLGAVLGAKKKDQPVADAPAPEPATLAKTEVAAGKPPTGDMPPAASMQLIMEKVKVLVGGGEWEEFTEGGFKMLVPGRSRDFKAARVSGIHEVSVRKLRGRENGRFATGIVVYLDDNLRDANGRYPEYAVIADWMAHVESWVKNAPVSDNSRAAAVRYMEAKLPTAFGAPGVADIEKLTVQSGLSFSFLTGGKASVGQTVKWLSVETTMALGGAPVGK